ncbi:hypothetical protein KKE03_00130 [Patescibacteria group bacterium]|nr:hypothetical protein [Patescibacteria group bacterium]
MVKKGPELEPVVSTPKDRGQTSEKDGDAEVLAAELGVRQPTVLEGVLRGLVVEPLRRIGLE